MSNNTKIKYLRIQNKIYQVNKLSFFTMSAEAIEIDLSPADVPEDETFDISDFKDFRLKLINRKFAAEIVDLGDYKKRRTKNNEQRNGC